MSTVLSTRGLTKRYKNVNAVKNVSIYLEKGHMYGFVGANGAGKTTTMRMIAGLTDPTSGEIMLLGKSSVKGLSEARQKVGFLVEQPIQYDDLSAKDNLELHMALYGKKDPAMVKYLLDLVGLAGTGKKAAKDFSLGMRQRLGIAKCLSSSPELLILDEPVNGLDPVGMVEVRHLIQKLNQEKGMTILVSSHILTELHQVVTDYIFISHGEVIKTLSKEELEKEGRKHLYMESPERDRLLEAMTTSFGRLDTEKVSGNGLKIYDPIPNSLQISQLILDAQLTITQLRNQGENLEEYYLKLIGAQNA